MPPESTNDVDDASVARVERRALGWAALAAMAIVLWLMRPVGMGILIGALMAFSFEPVYARISRRWPAPLSAFVTVIGSTLAIALTFGGLVWILIRDGTMFGSQLVESLGPGGGARRIFAAVASLTSRVGITAADLEAKTRAFVGGAVAHAAAFAEAVASTTASIVLALFFMMLTMYVILRQWQLVSETAQATLPLRPEYTHKLFDEFREVGRTTLLGTLLTSIVQGTLATIGYLIVRLPYPLFFGALTTITSPVPGVGTMLVWVPAGIVLIVLGHVGRGIVLLAWGVFVVTGLLDYVVRPRLVGHKSQMPALLTFAALFGGASVFGPMGLILGPLLMATALAVLRLYAQEVRAQRTAAHPG